MQYPDCRSPPCRRLRNSIPHETRAYAIANSIGASPESLVQQGFQNSAPISRSQEVSRMGGLRTLFLGNLCVWREVEVRRYIRKTPQTLACSGVIELAKE